MIQKEKGNSKKGFASMDRQKQREIASKGGHASALGDTSRRGFASMDKAKQREISSQGGRSQGSHRNNNKEDVTGQSDTNLSDMKSRLSEVPKKSSGSKNDKESYEENS